jgi:hypothetical protein
MASSSSSSEDENETIVTRKQKSIHQKQKYDYEEDADEVEDEDEDEDITLNDSNGSEEDDDGEESNVCNGYTADNEEEPEKTVNQKSLIPAYLEIKSLSDIETNIISSDDMYESVHIEHVIVPVQCDLPYLAYLVKDKVKSNKLNLNKIHNIRRLEKTNVGTLIEVFIVNKVTSCPQDLFIAYCSE